MSDALLSGLIEPISRQLSLSETAYIRLKEMIMRGTYPPSEKLTVRSVAAALGVSTTPARDAINRLLVEGALVNEGPKTVVLPTLTYDVLEEITETRLALEGLAAQRSVLRVTRADIRQLEALQEKINAGLDGGNYKQVMAANQEFHFLVYRLSGWSRLVTTIEALWLRIGPSFHDLYPEFANTRKGVSNHHALMTGLMQKDGNAVRSAIESDLRDGYEKLRAMLDERYARSVA